MPCQISDKKIEQYYIDRIRESVCRKLETREHTDGNHYCLLHFPSKEKDTVKFAEIFRSRLKETEDKATVMEKLAEDEREQARKTLDYDFRHVWFPEDLDLSGHKFLMSAYFGWAAFSGDTDFAEAVFSGNANFGSAKFSGDVNFGAKFSAEAYFTSAAFSGETDFDEATFSGNVNFSEAAFSKTVNFSMAFPGNVYFSKAAFSGNANFISAEFSGDAYFSEAKFSGDAEFDSAKFSGDAYFSEAEFSGNAFFGEETEFSGNAFFSGAAFSRDAYFSPAKFFGDAHFSEAAFSRDANFGAAEFSGDADFSEAVFSKSGDFKKTIFSSSASFHETEFSETAEIFFEQTKFYRAVNFREAVFEGFVSFADLGNWKVSFDLQNARLKIPERISFHTVHLRPNLFVNTDPRKMVFTDCRWNDEKVKTAGKFFRRENIKKNKFREFFKWKNIKGKTFRELLRSWWPKNEYMDAELKALTERGISEGNRLLGIAYRQLAVNAEENNRYEEAMRFRYLAMDLHRRADWWRRWPPITLHWWYWASSGYGEKALRALVMLLLVWVIPFVFYISHWAAFTPNKIDGANPPVTASAAPSLEATEAGFYSLNVMAFQKPDPKPANESPLTRSVVTLQTILGPVQAALLLLAIRRKFMR